MESRGRDIIKPSFEYRNEDYAEVKFYKIVKILKNSPVEKAGVKENQFLLGVYEFPYKNLDELIDWCR